MLSNIEQIKSRLSIADIVGGYVKLDKAGQNLRAKCPFHNEKTPSFHVSPGRGTYHCFGCGVGGDMFTFIENIEGLDFKGALRILADRAGVTLVYENNETKDAKDKLHEILEKTVLFFVSQLEANKQATKYLLSRGLSQETIHEFRLGYALPAWDTLLNYLKKQGYNEQDIEQAGLIKKNERGILYDRFRGRIMFPIFDTAGRAIAFSGRVYPKDEKKEVAKYINSPETDLFNKSSVLYGLNFAKIWARKLNCIIVVEGQMDLLMAHQSGYRNTVALSGTALTETHCLLIKRYTDNVVLSLDSDNAGMVAVGRSAEHALSLGLDVKVAHLPGGMDPADTILQNPEQWKQSITGAKHIIEFYLCVLESEKYDQRKYRISATRATLPFLSRIRSSVDRAHFVGLIAERLSLPEQAISEELSLYEQDVRAQGTLQKINERAQSKEIAIGAKKHGTRRETLEREIALLIFLQQSLREPIFILEDLKKELSEVLTHALEKLLIQYEPIRESAIFEAEAKYSSEQKIDIEIRVLLRELERALIDEQYHTALEEFQLAERSGDKAREKIARQTFEEQYQKKTLSEKNRFSEIN